MMRNPRGWFCKAFLGTAIATLAYSAALAEVTLEIGDIAETEVVVSEECTCDAEPCECNHVAPTFSTELWAPKRAYAWQEHFMTIVPTNAEEFGWFSWGSTPYLANETDFGLVSSVAVHWLKGPIATHIPPRVYDFSIGMQARKQLGTGFSYDVATTIGVYSDFEDSARDGVRYVGHAVGFAHMHPNVDVVFGVDYLDRDDIHLLPVIGLTLRNPELNVVADLVFPRPRITFVMDDEHRLFVAGRLGGGTWDIERPDETNDVFTYSEIAVTIGVDTIDGDGDGSGQFQSVELGYVFRRELEFRTSPIELELDDAFVLRFSTHY